MRVFEIDVRDAAALDTWSRSVHCACVNEREYDLHKHMIGTRTASMWATFLSRTMDAFANTISLAPLFVDCRALCTQIRLTTWHKKW